MRGFPHNNMLGNEFAGDAFSNERFFVWNVKRGPGSFPIATKIPGPECSRARIKGELYLVSLEHLSNIDRHRTNGVNFRRKLGRVYMPSKDLHQYPIEMMAWMYQGTDVWKKPIQFDMEFYRGREGSSYAPLRSVTTKDRAVDTFAPQYVEFKKEHCIERNPKCYVYGAINGLMPEEKKMPPTAASPKARANGKQGSIS